MGYVGIDYGMGGTNVDVHTGIRYGVIHANEVGQAWYDSAENEYENPTCGYCGSEDLEYLGKDYHCKECGRDVPEWECTPEDPIGSYYNSDGYTITQGGDDCDLFVVKAPYYTTCAFCSPCAPGAGYLLSTVDDGVKAYCLGHDWFESGTAPYPVYRVEDGTLVPGNA